MTSVKTADYFADKNISEILNWMTDNLSNEDIRACLDNKPNSMIPVPSLIDTPVPPVVPPIPSPVVVPPPIPSPVVVPPIPTDDGAGVIFRPQRTISVPVPPIPPIPYQIDDDDDEVPDLSSLNISTPAPVIAPLTVEGLRDKENKEVMSILRQYCKDKIYVLLGLDRTDKNYQDTDIVKYWSFDLDKKTNREKWRYKNSTLQQFMSREICKPDETIPDEIKTELIKQYKDPDNTIKKIDSFLKAKRIYKDKKINPEWEEILDIDDSEATDSEAE